MRKGRKDSVKVGVGKTAKFEAGKKREDLVKVGVGTADEFFERSAERAKKLARGEKLPVEKRITFEDPADLLRALTAQRVRVLHTIRIKSAPIGRIATVLKRDRKAVVRDVNVLESLGLVKIREEDNPGHGKMKVVVPLAQKYHLTATI